MPEEILKNEEINEILRQLEGEATEEDERLLRWILLGIGFDINIFATRIKREIAVLGESGATEQAIAEILKRDLSTNGRIFGELRNSIKRGIVLAIMQSSRFGQAAIYGDSVELFKWVNVEGHKICEDCLGRAGGLDTWEGWMSRGMPGSGWSLCSGNCYCILVPEGVKIDDTVSRV
jgi:hypothetical protein